MHTGDMSYGLLKPTQEELDLHEEHREKVTAFIARCQELNIGFENQTIMAARIDALCDALLGPRLVSQPNEEDGSVGGELIVGSERRLIFEIDVADRMLEMANSYGVQAALDMKPDLYVPGTPNRQQRRQQARRR